MDKASLDLLNKKIEKQSKFVLDLKKGIGKVIVGQDELINKILISIISNGHILLEGVPGLAKTLTINTIANLINADFKRIQFTPDMLPADLIGTLIYNQKTGDFVTKKGPIFSNIILADEINRAPSKVQSALLESMQERQVTIGEETFKLDPPYLVLATQNPIEQECTYPLPEAQVHHHRVGLRLGPGHAPAARLGLGAGSAIGKVSGGVESSAGEESKSLWLWFAIAATLLFICENLWSRPRLTGGEEQQSANA